MSLIFKKRGCISGQNTVKLSSFYPPEGTTATLPEKGHGLFLYQKASVCQSFVFPSLTVSGKFKKKGRETSNYLLGFISLNFVFFQHVSLFGVRYQKRVLLLPLMLLTTFSFFHGYVYPRINGNSHKPSSPGVGHKYICAYFRSWSHSAVSSLAAQLILPEERENPKIFQFFPSQYNASSNGAACSCLLRHK